MSKDVNTYATMNIHTMNKYLDKISDTIEDKYNVESNFDGVFIYLI